MRIMWKKREHRVTFFDGLRVCVLDLLVLCMFSFVCLEMFIQPDDIILALVFVCLLGNGEWIDDVAADVNTSDKEEKSHADSQRFEFNKHFSTFVFVDCVARNTEI